jgi:hypothetical protein
MNATIAPNQSVRQFLARMSEQIPVIAPADSEPMAYTQCGCHPDIVERLWGVIDATLPERCACLVNRTPALVQPQSAIVLAIGIGTQYALRLPPPLVDEAIARGAKTHTTWSGGYRMDTLLVLGPDWVFGGFLKEESAWCRQAYAMLGSDAR